MAYVIGDDCIACGTCQGECPVEAISEGEKYSIDPDLCTELTKGGRNRTKKNKDINLND